MNKNLILASAVALALGACVSTPKQNAALDSARTAVRSAETDTNVSQYAALDLSKAKVELQAAEDASKQHQEEDVNQHAYLAMQTARIAQLHGAAKADDARVANGQAERDQVQLAARSREVTLARQDAAAAKTATGVANAAAGAANAAADLATAQRDQLQQEMEQLKATQTARGLMMTLGDVMFDSGKSELKSGAARKLDQLAAFLVAHPNRRLQVDGFTDSVGSASMNEVLSQRRADSVSSALVNRGVAASRIGSKGYGKEYPVASNSEAAGRQLNRRVEVVIANSDNADVGPRTAQMP